MLSEEPAAPCAGEYNGEHRQVAGTCEHRKRAPKVAAERLGCVGGNALLTIHTGSADAPCANSVNWASRFASAWRRRSTSWRSTASCAAASSESAASSARHSCANASRPIPASKAARTKHSRCKAASSNRP
ncbi:Uncharacterised protein [Acinetobacter baumannii]|nr:Uncharacterised protein [Acinetobacter baumannii]